MVELQIIKGKCEEDFVLLLSDELPDFLVCHQFAWDLADFIGRLQILLAVALLTEK